MSELRDSKVSARYVLDDKYIMVSACVSESRRPSFFSIEWYLGKMHGNAVNKADSLPLERGQGTGCIYQLLSNEKSSSMKCHLLDYL